MFGKIILLFLDLKMMRSMSSMISTVSIIPSRAAGPDVSLLTVETRLSSVVSSMCLSPVVNVMCVLKFSMMFPFFFFGVG